MEENLTGILTSYNGGKCDSYNGGRRDGYNGGKFDRREEMVEISYRKNDKLNDNQEQGIMAH